MLEVDEGILEAADAMGATPTDCLALYAAGGSGIADSGPHHGDHRSARRHSHGGYSGRRGIGDLAITYGYQRFDAFATLTTATVLIVIVQLIQTLGTRLARRLRRD